MQKQSGHVKENVYAQVILEIKQPSLHVAYLRRPVEAALNVRVHGAVLKAGRSKVNDLDLPFLPFQQHILWLQITVNDLRGPQHTQRIQYLQCNEGLHCMTTTVMNFV